MAKRQSAKLINKIKISIVILAIITIFASTFMATSRAATSTPTPTPSTMKTYFDSSFTYLSSSTFGLNTNWPLKEPCTYPNEKGVWNWVNCRENGGNIRLVADPAVSGSYCLQMINDLPGNRPLSQNQAVKLYEVQDRQADNYSGFGKEAYYQMQYWFPSNFQVASWRLIWQSCGSVNDYLRSGNPQQQLTFTRTQLVYINDNYYFNDNKDRVYSIYPVANLPKDQWVTITVHVVQSSGWRVEDGTVEVWLNNAKIFESHQLSTATSSGSPYVVWGIGNYGSPYEAQGQYINIKNVMVTSASPTATPTTTPSPTQPPTSNDIILEDNFESKNLNSWSGTTTTTRDTVTAVNYAPYDGDYHARFYTSGSSQSTENAYLHKNVNLQTATATGQFYFSGYQSSTILRDNADRLYFIRFVNGNGDVALAGVKRENGVNKWTIYANGAQTSSAIDIGVGQYYDVTLQWNAAQHIAEMYVNGEKILESNTSSYTAITRVDMGIISTYRVQNPLIVYGDNFIISSQ